MLLELCVTELEGVATDSQSGRLSSQPVVVESSHPYIDDTSTSGTVKIPGRYTAILSLSSFLLNRLHMTHIRNPLSKAWALSLICCTTLYTDRALSSRLFA